MRNIMMDWNDFTRALKSVEISEGSKRNPRFWLSDMGLDPYWIVSSNGDVVAGCTVDLGEYDEDGQWWSDEHVVHRFTWPEIQALQRMGFECFDDAEDPF